MNSPDIFSYLAKFLARSKVHLLKNRRQSLILFCIAMIGWTFQVQAQSASGTATPPANAPAATPAPVDPAATPPATTSPDGFDKSKGTAGYNDVTPRVIYSAARWSRLLFPMGYGNGQ